MIYVLYKQMSRVQPSVQNWDGKSGKIYLQKITLSVTLGALMGALFSIGSALVYELAIDSPIASETGLASSIEDFKYEYVEDGMLKSTTTSFAYRCNDLININNDTFKNLNFDFSHLDGLDYNDFSFNRPSIKFYYNDAQDIYEVPTYSIAEIHNDILRCMIINGVPSLDIDKALSTMNLLEFKSPACYNSIEPALSNFAETGTQWITDSTYTLVEDMSAEISTIYRLSNNELFDLDNDKIINTTVNKFIEGVTKICKSEDPTGWEYFINRLTNDYINYINNQKLILPEVKHLIISSISVGAHSSIFWIYESELIY